MGLPAISVVAVAGRRAATIEIARRIEELGFSGIYLPSLGEAMSLAAVLAVETKRVTYGTTVQPIYLRHPYDFATAAAFIHEVSGGRFRFGIGVTHAPLHQRLGVRPGRPLADVRDFVQKLRQGGEAAGGLPPVILATLRRRMVELAGEIADGCVWANGARSHMQASLAHLPDARRDDPEFFVGNMIPTCISDDRDAAAAVMRRTLTGYVMLPNYRNYWIEAGYAEEMQAIEEAQRAGDVARIPSLMSDRWLRDVTLFGTVADVREGVEAWYGAGVRTPILVPSSASGGQMKAFEELFVAFSR